MLVQNVKLSVLQYYCLSISPIPIPQGSLCCTQDQCWNQVSTCIPNLKLNLWMVWMFQSDKLIFQNKFYLHKLTESFPRCNFGRGRNFSSSQIAPSDSGAGCSIISNPNIFFFIFSMLVKVRVVLTPPCVVSCRAKAHTSVCCAPTLSSADCTALCCNI